MKISVWGNELSAWVTGIMLSRYGNLVNLVSAEPPSEPFSEPQLTDFLTQALKEEVLFLGQNNNSHHADMHFFCFSANEKERALSAANEINKNSEKASLIINQSNFGIGSTLELQKQLSADKNHQVAYIPDNIPEGKAIDHLRNLNSLIIGCEHEPSIQKIKATFRPFLVDPQKVLVMSAKEAEFSKFAVTGMLALRIGYINELANLADELELDIEPVRHAMTTDPRISPEYLKPGCGFGGMNFSQYIEGLADILKEERRSTLLQSVLEQNESQKETPFRKLWRHFNGDLSGKTIAIWGLSFKPNTASIDNAASIKIIDALLAQGVSIRAHDSAAGKLIAKKYGGDPNFKLCSDKYKAAENADALVLLTEWRHYSAPDFEGLKKIMRQTVIIDGRNLFDKQSAQQAGFTYVGIGR